MDELVSGIIIVIISAVIGGSIGYCFKKRQIKNEYDRRLIDERTKDFLNDLKKYYMPLGYYSSLLTLSSLTLSSELAQGEKNDDSIKHMLFDLGNYIHRFLYISEELGYPIFPNYERRFKIVLHHLGIVKALCNILTPDPMTVSILRNISRKCNNNYEEFSKEIDKSEILKEFKDNPSLTEDSLNEMAKYSHQMYLTVEESIDSALEPWYISYSPESKEAYEDREQIRKKIDEDIIAMFRSH